jgi:CRP-like cAMP-binding protein/uncharacterized protein (DUF486 family)
VAGLLSSLPAQVSADLGLLVLAWLTRFITTNRVIRSRVRLTSVLALVLIGINGALAVPNLLRAETRPIAVSVSQLLFVFALIHFIVLIAVNPLRADRVPERFPTIVQDVIVFVVFALFSTLVLQEKFLTTSAVGAVVAGFALQDTLGNLVSGLAIQVEKPFQLGHWISVGQLEGEVSEITWRAVKVCTRQGNQVIIPNGELAKSALVNYSEPSAPTRIHVDVGTSYDDPPNRVKAAILGALEREPLVLKTPHPYVLFREFGPSSLNYRSYFWIDRLPMDDMVKDRVLTAIYYTLKRHGITIPFPIQIEYKADLPVPGPDGAEQRAAEALVSATGLFGLLTSEERHELVLVSPIRPFGAGEPIVVQGQPGESAYVVCAGRVRVSLDPGDHELAVLERGSYFGEMSLLTGEARTATVRAHGDCKVLEVTAEHFRRFILENPAIVEGIATVVADRRAGLAKARSSSADAASVETARSLVARVRRFFGV